jgi:glycosyltransferase involved in cell wall biosynthesis
LNLTQDDLAVGSIGQLTPRKGQMELIEAFQDVARELPNAKLFIVGQALFNRDHEYAAELKGLTESLGLTDRVFFLGSRDDVPRLIQALDVMVVNSHQEPFALTVLEGLASGSAVLATAVGGTPEMIEHEKNGWLVPPKNRAELTGGILTLLRDDGLRRRLGQEARQHALARFTIERFMSELRSLYRLIIAADKIQREKVTSFKVKLSAD